MKTLGFYAILIAIGVALDQWIKWLVETHLDMHATVDILPFLALYRTHNTGIAFSMLDWMAGPLLIAITIAVIAFVTWLALRTEPHQTIGRIGFALVIAGALGNLIDRVWLGYVVDYMLFHLPNWSFAIFNLADALITIGAGMIILEEFIGWRREKRAKIKQ
jgi:signal peptidase II